MLHRVEEEPHRNRDDSRDTHQRTDWLTDFDSDEEEQPLISKQKQLTAALCKGCNSHIDKLSPNFAQPS